MKVVQAREISGTTRYIQKLKILSRQSLKNNKSRKQQLFCNLKKKNLIAVNSFSMKDFL